MSRVQPQFDLRFFTPEVRQRTQGRLPGFFGPRVNPDNRVGQEAAQLSQALAQINPQLQRGLVQVNDANRQDAVEGALADRARLQVSFKEAVDQGLIEPEQSPFYREAWEQRDGIVAASQFRAKVRQELYESGTINADDPEEVFAFLEERKAALLDGQSRHFTLGFSSEYDAIFDGVMSERHQRFVQNERVKGEGSLREGVSVEVERALELGAFDGNTQALDQMADVISQLGQQAFEGGMAGGQVNQLLAEAFAAIAQEHPDLAEEDLMALADKVRTGPGGQHRLSSVAAVRSIIAPRDEELTDEEYRQRIMADRLASIERGNEDREKRDRIEALFNSSEQIVFGSSDEDFSKLLAEVSQIAGPAAGSSLISMRQQYLSLQNQTGNQGEDITDQDKVNILQMSANLAANGGKWQDLAALMDDLNSEGLVDPTTYLQAVGRFNAVQAAVNSDQYPQRELAAQRDGSLRQLNSLLSQEARIPNPDFVEWSSQPVDPVTGERQGLPPASHIDNPDYPEWLDGLSLTEKFAMQQSMNDWMTSRQNELYSELIEGRDLQAEPLLPAETQALTSQVQAEALELIKEGGPAQFRQQIIEPARQRRELEQAEAARKQEVLSGLQEDPTIAFDVELSRVLRNDPGAQFDANLLENVDADANRSRGIGRTIDVGLNRILGDGSQGGPHSRGPEDLLTNNLVGYAHEAASLRHRDEATRVQFSSPRDDRWEGSDVQEQVENTILSDFRDILTSRKANFGFSTDLNDSERAEVLQNMRVVLALTPPSLDWVQSQTIAGADLRMLGLERGDTYWTEYPLFWSEQELREAVDEQAGNADSALFQIVQNSGYDLNDPAILNHFIQIQRQRIAQAQRALPDE